MDSTFDELISLVPSEFENVSGKVFYSGREAFVQPAPIYLLGMNPGGSPEDQWDETVSENVRFVSEASQPWSAFLDEDWHGKAKIMRESVPLLAKQLDMNLRTVPASNLLFLRSETVERLYGDINRLENLCWPFHEHLISRLKPKVVVCMGFSNAGPRTRRRLRANEPVMLKSATSDQVRAYRNREGLIVADVRHPSRYWTWTNPKFSPTAGLQELLGSA